MKTIGLLGGTGWSSTIIYYKMLNELVQERLGGRHSAKMLLKSIDYHEIQSNYGKNHDRVAALLEEELRGLIALKPDCILIGNMTLHKYYDVIKDRLCSDIPVFHALDLVVQRCQQQYYKKVLLLATKNTLEDGFFAKKLEQSNIVVTIPNHKEREEIHQIHGELVKDVINEKSKKFFSDLIASYQELDAVILGCTELPLVVQQENSLLPIIDPIRLQTRVAVDDALAV
ncbi:MAG: aspartate/glutamate racemase family protein [Chthoniobacterales bacterium]